MQFGILVTDHGKHSAEKWAVHTAGHVIQVAATAQGVQAIDGRKLELRIIDVLEKIHQAAMDHEQGKLAELGAERHPMPHEPGEFANQALNEIGEAAKGTIFADHFDNPETINYLMPVLLEHFAAAMEIERQWHGSHPSKAQSAGAA